MEQNNVSPGQYSAPSTAGSVLAGGVGGALMGSLKWGLVWIGALAAGGAYLGFTLATATATGGLSALLPSWGIIAAVFGGLSGAAFGTFTYTTAAGLGAVVGGVSGASRASRRAQEQQVALDMMQAQTMPQPYRAFPAAGSQFNQASPMIQADSVQRDGPIAGQVLQRA